MPTPEEQRIERLRQAIATAVAGAETAARTPEQISALDIPGTLSGLGAAATTPTVPTRSDIAARAERARAREADRARYESTLVDPADVGRDIGRMAGSETLAGVLGEMGRALPSYDPVALGSSFNPLSDEIIAGAESVAGGRPYRERQAELEQRFAEAQARSPGSSALGEIGQAATIGVLLPSLGVRSGGAIGAGLGGTGGYLGSEGGTAGERAAATLGGALGGGALGTLAGLGTEAGQLMRAGADAGIGRHVFGTALESGGGGLGMGALTSGGRVGSRQQIDDAARAALAGAIPGAVLGGVSGIASRVAPAARRLATPGERRAPATGPVDVDETALEFPELVEIPDVSASSSGVPGFDPRAIADSVPFEPSAGMFAVDPDIERLVAAGAVDRPTLNRLALAFGGGQRGIARAAEVARTSGISTPGRRATLADAYNRSAAVRDASGEYLSGHHARAAGAGATYRGGVIADELEARARRLIRPTSSDDDLALAAEYQDAAMRYRYGRATPERDAYERARITVDEAPFVDDADIIEGDLPDLSETTLTGLPPERAIREMAPARRIPYAEARGDEASLIERGKIFNRANPPTTARDRIIADEYAALTRERPLAAAAVLPGEMDDVRRANEAFRLSMTLAPRDRVGAAPIARQGILRSMFGRGAESNLATGIGRGFLERGFAQVEPSIMADLAEGGAPTVRRALANLGRGSERLSSLAQSAAPLAAARGSTQIGPDAGVLAATSDAERRASMAELASTEDEEQGGFARFASESDETPLTREDEEEQGGFARFASERPRR